MSQQTRQSHRTDNECIGKGTASAQEEKQKYDWINDKHAT